MPQPVDLIGPLVRLFRPGETVVVAVSGGPDSLALLHGLLDSNRRESLALRFHVAHLDHQLRGAESDGDAAFVADQAAKLHVPTTIESRDIGAIAEGAGLSLESAGRQERHALFHRVCLRTGAKAVALGHHADDNAETVLHRILRGTGIRGLSGIPETRPLFAESDIRLVRPLLRVNRGAILAYLEKNGIPYRMDASNASLEPTRNRIRHEILPALESINPRVRDALLRLAQQADWVAEHLDDAVVRSFDSLIVERSGRELVLDADALGRKSRALQAEVLRHAFRSFHLGERDLSFEHLDACLDLLNADAGAGRFSFPKGLFVEKRYHRLAFTLAPEPCEPPGDAEFVIAFNESTRIPEWGLEISCRTSDASAADLAVVDRKPTDRAAGSGYDELVDADSVHLPLIARHRRPGDRFTPLGAPGAKTVADFLVDAKVERADRDRQVMLADRLGVVWLLGLRIDDRVKLTSTTRRVLRLSARFFEQP